MLESVDGLLITTSTNIRYLTGFIGVAPEEREAYVLVIETDTYLFTSSLYLEQAKKLPNGVVSIEISRENPLSKELGKVLQERNIKKLGFEEVNLTVAELRKLQKELNGIELIPTQNRVEDQRAVKRKDEIDQIRLAANITDQCFKYIRARIRPRVTEAKLAWEIEGFLRFKAGGIAFAPIVAFNENSSQPHYHGRSNNPLRRGSLVLLDFGARVNGYCADMTRVVFFGSPKPEWIKAYEAVLAANKKALSLLTSGTRNGAALDQAARNVITQAGFPPYPHSLGHAVGLDIHEAPRLSVKKDETLKPGMVVTIEPAIYTEGQYGIRIEDLVRLNETTIEVLSKSPKEMIAL